MLPFEPDPRAGRAQGLTLAQAEPHVHDVLNVFMCTGFTRDTGQYFMKASPVRPGDYLEFFAEIDLLGALSACPGGDCSAEHSSDAARCHPLKVEVYRPRAAPVGWARRRATATLAGMEPAEPPEDLIQPPAALILRRAQDEGCGRLWDKGGSRRPPHAGCGSPSAARALALASSFGMSRKASRIAAMPNSAPPAATPISTPCGPPR